jgi:hypothetical protein
MAGELTLSPQAPLGGPWAGKRVGVIKPKEIIVKQAAHMKPVEMIVNGEVYDDQESGERVFIPRDRAEMVSEVVVSRLREGGLNARELAEAKEAVKPPCDILILLRVDEFRAILSDRQRRPILKAVVRLGITFIETSTRANLGNGDVAVDVLAQESLGDEGQTSIVTHLEKDGSALLLLGEEEVFRPLRLLLAVATYKAAGDLLAKLGAGQMGAGK